MEAEPHPQTESSLDRWFGNLVKPDEMGMQPLGVFGGSRGRVRDGGHGRLQWRHDAHGGYGRNGGAWATSARDVRRTAGGRRCARRAWRLQRRSCHGQALSDDKAGEVVSADAFGGESGPPAPVQPVVRTNFADTAYWAAALSTGPDGTAEVEFPCPRA